MNEHSFIFAHSLEKDNVKHISANLFRAANLASIVSSDPNVLRYAFKLQLLFRDIFTCIYSIAFFT